MSYEFYRILHILGAFMILLSLGGLMLHVIAGGTRNNPWRKQAAITHGAGMFCSLVGGFGAMAKLGIDHFPLWIIIKLVIWLIFGVMIGVILRKPKIAPALWWITLALGGTAVSLAVTKLGG